MCQRLGRNRELERHPRREDQIECAILVIHCEEPVESEQAGEQCPEPQHARPQAAEQGKVGTNGEGHHREQQGEEQNADQCATSHAHGEP